jgi:hypothetical protein
MEQLRIPPPPAHLLDSDAGFNRFEPDSFLSSFVTSAILSDLGSIHNPEHGHLLAADIGYLWTNTPNSRLMKRIVGTAEIPNFKGGKWQKARGEMQLIDWFGSVPDFVITIDAGFAAEVDDVSFLALLEHELYHCGQAVDFFGAPKFTKTGRPVFAMRGHDIEEFAGVIRRYGIEAAGRDAADLVSVALEAPELSRAVVAAACGVCAF